MSLLDKMRKSRESMIELGEYRIKIRRPSDLDLADRPDEATARENINFWTQFVVGWSGVKESDLYHGGVKEEAAFDLETFRYWIEDNPEYWQPLIIGVRESWVAFRERIEGDTKN